MDGNADRNTPAVEAFTDRARRAIGRADRIARDRGAAFIDTPHLLLALVEAGSGLGAEVLAGMGVNEALVARVLDRIEREIGSAESGRVEHAIHMPLTRQAEEAITIAQRRAGALGHRAVGTEHLLLGLLDQGTGAAAGILEALGVTAAAVRGELLRRVLEGLEGRLPRRRGAGEGTRGSRPDAH